MSHIDLGGCTSSPQYTPTLAFQLLIAPDTKHTEKSSVSWLIGLYKLPNGREVSLGGKTTGLSTMNDVIVLLSVGEHI